MKRIILIATIFITFNVKAQVNLLANFDPHSKSSASELFPSRLSAPGINNEIHLFSIYAGGSNTTMNYKTINQLSTDSTINVGNIKDKFKTRNYAFAKVEVPLLDVIVTIRKRKPHPITLQAGSRFIVEGNIGVPKNLISLVSDGNAQWAGQTVNLGPIQGNAIAMIQHYVGASTLYTVNIMDKSIILSPAVRFKYIRGFENVYTKKSDVSLYTDPDGRYLEANFNYNINYSLPDSAKSASDILKARGTGYAIDLGIGAQYGDKWTVDLSVTNLGSVRFTKDVSNISKNGMYKYDGMVTQFDYFGHYAKSTVPSKSLITPDSTHNSYTTPLGAKLALMVNYHTGKVLNKKGDFKHYRHNFYFMYLQGFQTIYNTVNKPNVTLGYAYSMKKILDVGAVVSAGGYYPIAAGAIISAKFGIHTISLGSNNLTYLISPSLTYGADFFIKFGFVF